MLVTNMWFNLAVKDLKKSMAFYKAISFEILQRPEQEDHMFGIQVGASSPIMFVEQPTFYSYIQQEVTGQDVLISLSVTSEKDLDNLIIRITEAGGTLVQPKHERDGFLGCVFQDIDQHFFNVLVFKD
ncbi:member of glyoxalase/bleomycin resistance protein family [Staphylococcus agnetis]|nr:VOC family protein [Staphylococcus agnetis]MCO4338194.1 member of glyoxalase/bleomycin resistance protein family [Staphylococcus agnetis]MCO4343656.1 member of glyoxalase/bleomycin resistance protein family [Staphylococcus agnetis]MCO4348344.1 member of glyoxalase/bleomycin resistance protein family [Staphylococcus agnetis]MCO4350650.1 member of glyoxalase/bleomycin resistance protein family [Staphylococcus agnetis]MCO4352909.1 member of glyoxalase/bleomycin resistance protein family [Staph